VEQLFHIPKIYTSVLLESLHFAKYDKGWSYPNHRHFLFEFIYCAAGSMEQWVNGQPYVLHEGDSLIIKNGLFHHTEPLSVNTDVFVFHFDIDVKEVQSIFQLIPSPFIPSDHPGDGAFSVRRSVNDFIAQHESFLIRHDPSSAMAQSEQTGAAIYLLRMQTQMLEFICSLADYFSKETNLFVHNRMTPSQIHLAHEAAYHLELHSEKRFQINELAKTMGVHRSYLSTCFKRVYGMSPRAYLTKIKIRTAKQLLQHNDWTIEEIAAKLEFSSPAHFSTFFQNTVGQSPLKYRNQLYD
jgi:AraC-like DNA-binding protein